jgi:polyphenol oxidase
MMLIADSLGTAPGIRHAFFTRADGQSRGIYRGLNCGFGSADDAEAVRANRARAMAALGLPADALATPFQVHSARVLVIDAPGQAAGQRLDALVTRRPGIALGILSADCAPLLFCDPDARVIGAAHAGWKGARFGVAAATVRAMESLGAARSRIRAAIGPTIGSDSYEVGPEFAAHFLGESQSNGRFFRKPAGAIRHFFDLPGYLEQQLRSLGIGSVESLAADTVADPERFFSYRRSVLRSEPDYGRLLSAIALAE